MDLFLLIVSIYGLLAIFIGALTNAFVIWKLMRRRRCINDVFPLNMAVADLICLFCELFGILHLLGWPKRFVHVQLPAFLCVLGTFTEYVCIMVSLYSFFSYLLLRFLVIMYPLKCHLYLKRRYVFSIAAFNFLFAVFYTSDYLVVYSDLLVSTKMMGYFGWDNRPRPYFYEFFKNGTAYFSTSLFVLTTLLVAFTCHRLIKQGPYNSVVCNNKHKAIRTICLSFFVFTAFQVLFVVTVLLYKNEMISSKVLWSFFIFRLYGYAINPLLYYKAENSTESVKKKKQKIIESVDASLI